MSSRTGLMKLSTHRRDEPFIAEDAPRAILSEALLRAVLDAKGTGSPPPSPSEIASARRYVFEDSHDPHESEWIFSFHSICSLLGLQPRRVRAALAEFSPQKEV